MSFLSKQQKGFSLAELVVSIAIMTIITAIILFNQKQYNNDAAIQNLANDISLSLRQAQVYGVSVKEFSPGSNEFTSAYGLSFNLTTSGSNNAFIFFADRGTRNTTYDSTWSCPLGGSSECVDKTTLTSGLRINALCSVPISGAEDCSPQRLDITFLRPSTYAQIVFLDSGGFVIPYPNAQGARIELISPTGTIRSVIVYKTGQISVQ